MNRTARLDGNHWVINGRKALIADAESAGVGIVMAKFDDGACVFVAELPDPAITIERVPNTIDGSMPVARLFAARRNLQPWWLPTRRSGRRARTAAPDRPASRRSPPA